MITIDQVHQLPALHTMTIPTDYIDNLGHMNMNRYWYFHPRSIDCFGFATVLD